jgi:hypothetical protein
MSGTKETQHRNRTQRFWHHLLHCRWCMKSRQ